MTTIPEMVAKVEASRALYDISGELVPVDDYAEAVTAAERLAKALAMVLNEEESFGRKADTAKDAIHRDSLDAVIGAAATTLDELWPNWREEA